MWPRCALLGLGGWIVPPLLRLAQARSDDYHQGTVRVFPAMLALGLLVVLVGCARAPSRYPYASEPDPRRCEYVIGPGDRLSIRVWGNSDLSTDAAVRPDGTITMPLVGDIIAAGQTPTKLKSAITRALTAFIKTGGSSSVTVSVAQTSYRITVSGNVNAPGVFESQRFLTVSEAMVLAGGPSRFASPRETLVIRTGADGRVRRIPIDYEEVEAGHHPEQDLALLNGDRIHVP